jgi:3-hydroxyisobutyrate dehydrogenase
MDGERTAAVLGTGAMGAPMARRLLAAGFGVRAWNRTRERADALAADGAVVCDSPADAVAGAGFVLTMLTDGPAVESVLVDGGALDAMAADTVWVQTSTVGVADGDRLIALAAERGLAIVDAPVVGTVAPAERGELIVLASGAGDLRSRVEPLLKAIGRTIMWLGPAGAGSRMKMVTNVWILAVTEAAAEAVALAQALGLDAGDFLEAMAGSQIDCPYLQMKGRAILKQDFRPSFRLRLAAKDAGLVLDAARLSGIDSAVARAVRDRLARAIELGHGDEDLAATYFATAPA